MNRTATSGRLVAFRNDRLGARLISMLNAMRLGRSHAIPFAVHWPEAIDVGHVFNDPAELFAAEFVASHFIGAEEWRALRPRAERIGNVLARGAERLTRLTEAGRDITVDQAFNIAILAGEDEAEVRRAFAQTLDDVPFAPALTGPAKIMARELRGATAYHIRRGDLTDAQKAMNKAWPHKFVPDEFYRHHIARELGHAARVIVFSDDPGTVARFKAEFPAIVTVEDLAPVASLHPGARDLLELYAMSRCAKIIAPDRSAFSSTAADLGGAVKIDVVSDMDDALREAALERLCQRLSQRPESFSGDGEIAQSLAHAVPYLTGRSEHDVAAALVRRRVAAGLNISFLYPQLMALQHRIGDVAGVLDTARMMDERFVLHTKDFAVAEVWRGYALVRAGEADAALTHFRNAFWHDPGRAEVKGAVSLLVHGGVLNARNFLPVERTILHLRRRRGPVRQLAEEMPDLVRLCGAEELDALPPLDPIAWDWDPLMRSQLTPGAVRKGVVGGFRKLLATVAVEDEAVRHSLAALDALLQAHEGDVAAACDRLTAIAGDAPGDPTVLHRLSHVQWLARDFAAAADSAERAVAAGPDRPALAAWAGMMHLRVKDWGAARDRLAHAHAALSGLPSIPALLAEAVFRTDGPAAAVAANAEALALSPLDARCKMADARYRIAAGDKPGAMATLGDLLAWERAPQRAYPMLAELLIEAGNRDHARTIVEEGLVRASDNARLIELRDELTDPPRLASG